MISELCDNNRLRRPGQTPLSLPTCKRIVLTTFGSYGDLHPYIAIAQELRRRGHEAVIATSELYRDKVMAAGLGFYPVRPDFPSERDSPGVFKEIMRARTGTEYLLRRVALPYIRESYEDLTATVRGADLLISHPTTFAAPLVAQAQAIPWVSTVLAPLSFLSVYDTLALAQAPRFRQVRRLGPVVLRALRAVSRLYCLPWFRPIRQLRRDLRLSPGGHPVFEGQHSPDLVLALFSRIIGDPQPDWPPQAVVTGFPFLEIEEEPVLDTRLSAFLDAGPPPIVFTLGTLAVQDAGAFYIESAAAAAKLGQRSLLLVGSSEESRGLLDGSLPLPPGAAAFSYAPYSAVFPRASIIVHQGGAGTIGQALLAGRPMLLMPCAHDQPDNAARVVRLGAGRMVPREDYTSDRVVAELSTLFTDPSYAARARSAQAMVQQEDGVRTACDAIEALLAARIVSQKP